MDVYISELANFELAKYLKGLGHNIKLVKKSDYVQSPISSHADIYMCKLKDGIYFGDKAKLSSKYPNDVLYNAAWVGKYFICSKYTDKDLINAAKSIIVQVSQGYVKCNLLVIDDSHVITEDLGIYKTLCEKTDLSCLLINPREVKLPGFEYGFIGGCAGRIAKEIIFNGDISKHSSYKDIKAFIESCGLGIKYFKDYDLTDIGSIIASE